MSDKQSEALELADVVDVFDAQSERLPLELYSDISSELRRLHAENERLNNALQWEQNRSEHIGTHGPGCHTWGHRHYACLLRQYRALLELLKLGAAMYSPAGTAHAQIAASIAACREALAQKDEQESAAIGEEWTPCMKLPIVVHCRKQREGETHVSTREGITPVMPDDLIMRGVAGEEYPIGRELFDKTYTLLGDQK